MHFYVPKLSKHCKGLKISTAYNFLFFQGAGRKDYSDSLHDV